MKKKKRSHDGTALLASSSSTSRRDTQENLHAKSIGCMSGIFHFVYNRRSRGKLLTSGKKQEKNTVSSSVSNKTSKLTCDVHRSPTLPAEIRTEKVRTPTSNEVVTNLIADEDESVAAAEKRRKLLEALEKCDEDLKALKKIIEVVKSDNNTNSEDDQKKSINYVSVSVDCRRSDKCLQIIKSSESQQPSPVSVLDGFAGAHSPLDGGYYKRYINGQEIQQQQQQKQHKQKKKPGEEEDIITSMCFIERLTNTESIQPKKKSESAMTSPLWASKAMINSVDEVCKDIDWGQKREIGRIGLALQEHICRDLIEEIVKELRCCCKYPLALPFQACKRSLRF